VERHGGLEGFQTFIYLRGCMGRIYSLCDVQAFHAKITIQCREPKHAD
jgi:hypothetical protein